MSRFDKRSMQGVDWHQRPHGPITIGKERPRLIDTRESEEMDSPFGLVGVHYANAGAKLRELREIAGVTLAELSDEMLCHHSRISLIENGKRGCSTTFARQYVKALDLVLDRTKANLQEEPLY